MRIPHICCGNSASKPTIPGEPEATLGRDFSYAPGYSLRESFELILGATQHRAKIVAEAMNYKAASRGTQFEVPVFFIPGIPGYGRPAPTRRGIYECDFGTAQGAGGDSRGGATTLSFFRASVFLRNSTRGYVRWPSVTLSLTGGLPSGSQEFQQRRENQRCQLANRLLRSPISRARSRPPCAPCPSRRYEKKFSASAERTPPTRQEWRQAQAASRSRASATRSHCQRPRALATNAAAAAAASPAPAAADQAVTNFRPDLEVRLADARPDPGQQLRGRRSHGRDGSLQHPRRQAAPAGMGRTHAPIRRGPRTAPAGNRRPGSRTPARPAA